MSRTKKKAMIDCLNYYTYVFKLIIMWIVLLLNPIFYIAAANKICHRAILVIIFYVNVKLNP